MSSMWRWIAACILIFWLLLDFLIAAGAPAWPPVQKAETCHALVLLPVPSHSSTPELCQGQNTASIWATENTRDSQNLWKSKTTSLGSRQWQMSRVCSPAHCMCRFYHLCKSLKAMRDCWVACTDGQCIKVLPSAGLALHVNKVWNNVWAGNCETIVEEKKMERRKRGDRRAGGWGWGEEELESWWGVRYTVRGAQWLTFQPIPSLPGKVLLQHLLPHEMSKTAHLCGWWTFQS